VDGLRVVVVTGAVVVVVELVDVVVSPGYVVVVVELVVEDEVEVEVGVEDTSREIGFVTPTTTIECHATNVPGAGDWRTTLIQVLLVAPGP
jgi:hypothetical protein